jgi:hypothetical protein
MEALAEVAGVCWRSEHISDACTPLRIYHVLAMSAMVIDNGGSAPLADFQDTVFPSVDMNTVPSCFLYWAAALDIVVEERGCLYLLSSREPHIYRIT